MVSRHGGHRYLPKLPLSKTSSPRLLHDLPSPRCFKQWRPPRSAWSKHNGVLTLSMRVTKQISEFGYSTNSLKTTWVVFPFAKLSNWNLQNTLIIKWEFGNFGSVYKLRLFLPKEFCYSSTCFWTPADLSSFFDNSAFYWILHILEYNYSYQQSFP